MRTTLLTLSLVGILGMGAAPTASFAAGFASSLAQTRLSKVVLNPQPLPPRETAIAKKGIIVVGGKLGSDRMLNPQPLPPRDSAGQKGIIIVSGKSKLGSDRMLNPQPLPPRDSVLAEKGIIVVGGKSKIGSDRMLNPQPLPPKAAVR